CFGPEAKEALPLIVGMVKDKDADFRSEAVALLGWLGQAAEPAIPSITAALRDEDDEGCHTALHALASLGSVAKPAIPDLLEALKPKRELRYQLGMGPMGQVRWDLPTEAASVLAQIGLEDKQAIQGLAKAVRDGTLPYNSWPRKVGRVNEATVVAL